MKNKKLVSLVMAVLMLAAMTAPACALSASKGASTKITGKCTLPDIEIEVSVPTSGKVYINPKSIPVKVSGKIEDGQIVTDSAYIENRSEVPVKVSVTATGTVKTGSTMTLNAATTVGLTTTAKKAFVYFEIQAVSDPDNVSWDSEYDAEKHLVVRTTSKTMKDITTLGASGKDKCYGAFRLAGDCVENPKSAWTSKDGFVVDIAFTFTPLATTDNP